MIDYVVLLNRREDMPSARFEAEWLGRHAGMVRQLPGVRGGRLEPTIDVTGYPPPFTGIGTLQFDTVEAALAAFQSPQGAQIREHTASFAEVSSIIRLFASPRVWW